MSIVERIARGIHASLSGVASIDADSAWDEMADAEQAPYVTAAIRMLTIIRTPSDEMLKAGNRAGAPGDAANVWERMAYTALYEANHANTPKP
ncbi:hypothetical protein BH10PSE14_BH10PSE14_31410 [soil metagenome]